MSSDNVAAILQEEGNDEGEVAAKGLTGWGRGTGPGRVLTFNLFIWFLDSVLLYSPGCPGTCCVDQDDLELKILLALPLQCWIKGVHYYVLPKNFIYYLFWEREHRTREEVRGQLAGRNAAHQAWWRLPSST